MASDFSIFEYPTLPGREIWVYPQGTKLSYRCFFSEAGGHVLVEKMIPESATRAGQVRAAHWRVVRGKKERQVAIDCALQLEAGRLAEIGRERTRLARRTA